MALTEKQKKAIEEQYADLEKAIASIKAYQANPVSEKDDPANTARNAHKELDKIRKRLESIYGSLQFHSTMLARHRGAKGEGD